MAEAAEAHSPATEVSKKNKKPVSITVNGQRFLNLYANAEEVQTFLQSLQPPSQPADKDAPGALPSAGSYEEGLGRDFKALERIMTLTSNYEDDYEAKLGAALRELQRSIAARDANDEAEKEGATERPSSPKSVAGAVSESAADAMDDASANSAGTLSIKKKNESPPAEANIEVVRMQNSNEDGGEAEDATAPEAAPKQETTSPLSPADQIANEEVNAEPNVEVVRLQDRDAIGFCQPSRSEEAGEEEGEGRGFDFSVAANHLSLVIDGAVIQSLTLGSHAMERLSSCVAPVSISCGEQHEAEDEAENAAPVSEENSPSNDAASARSSGTDKSAGSKKSANSQDGSLSLPRKSHHEVDDNGNILSVTPSPSKGLLSGEGDMDPPSPDEEEEVARKEKEMVSSDVKMTSNEDDSNEPNIEVVRLEDRDAIGFCPPSTSEESEEEKEDEECATSQQSWFDPAALGETLGSYFCQTDADVAEGKEVSPSSKEENPSTDAESVHSNGSNQPAPPLDLDEGTPPSDDKGSRASEQGPFLEVIDETTGAPFHNSTTIEDDATSVEAVLTRELPDDASAAASVRSAKSTKSNGTKKSVGSLKSTGSLNQDLNPNTDAVGSIRSTKSGKSKTSLLSKKSLKSIKKKIGYSFGSQSSADQRKKATVETFAAMMTAFSSKASEPTAVRVTLGSGNDDAAAVEDNREDSPVEDSVEEEIRDGCQQNESSEMNQSEVVTESDIEKAKKWKAVLDEKSGKHYYYHRSTKLVMWDKPVGFDESRKLAALSPDKGKGKAAA